jgi:hypothetical protein
MSKRKLRSNFPRGSYLWAVRRAHYKALGIYSRNVVPLPKGAVLTEGG